MRAVQPRPCSSLGTRVTTKAPDLRISKKNIAEREIFTASTFGKPSHRKGAISSKLTAFKETSQGRRPKSAVEKLTGSAWESHRNAIEAVKKKVKKLTNALTCSSRPYFLTRQSSRHPWNMSCKLPLGHDSMTEAFLDPEKLTNMRTSLEQKNQDECTMNKHEGEKQ